MNKIYIVHCWDGTKDDGWYPWLDKELSNENTIVYRFNMPNTESPKIEEWTSFLDKQVERLDAKVAGMVFLMELKGLHGRDRLKDYRIEAAISYDGK